MCINPVILVATLVLNLLFKMSIIKKNKDDSIECVITKSATIISEISEFHNRGKNKIFISCTVLYAINFFKSSWCHILIEESIIPIITIMNKKFI